MLCIKYFILLNMILPTLDLEYKYWNKNLNVLVGVDEAGRGPLAGPVVAGAVVVFPERIKRVKTREHWQLIRDSKTLSAKQREKAYSFIAENFSFGAGWCGEKTIDRINIMQATFLAMKKALSDLKRKIKSDPSLILLDGKAFLPNISLKQKPIMNGDRTVFSISAASIVAKVTRDRMMLDYHRKFPQYGFDRHKGYGTKLHFEMLKKFGPCGIHRKTFVKPKTKDQKPKI